MKKLIAVLMCAALLFSLTACSGGNDTGENVTPDSSTKADTSAPETTEAQKPIEPKISRGTISGDVYANEFFGFTFTKPAEWNYLTDKEISETVNIGQDAMDLNLLEKALTETATIYDMTAQDAYGNSVMVCYENTMITALREITVDEYEQIMKTNLENVTEVDYEFQSSEDINFGDTTFKKIVFSAKVDNVEMSQAYYVRIIGKYVVTVITTALTEDVETIEAFFNK